MNRTDKVDVHAHFLPNVDDGAKDEEESMAMLAESFRQGVEVCVATPHAIIHKNEDVDSFLKLREGGLEKLKKKLDGVEYPKILLGAEVYLDNDINRYDGIERLCAENSEYMMLEFPVKKSNPAWSEWIYNLNRKGIKVLVAHVDRYVEWEKMMSDFSGLDVMYQVNASRFTEFRSGGLLKKLMRYNHSYIVSSDMHNLTARRCNMAQAYEKAAKKMPQLAPELFCLNARKMLGL